MIQPRIEDPQDPDAPQRWIPRLRKGSAYASSNVFSVVEMAIAMRRDVFDRTGGWPSTFWYAHEGIEFAWRVWDTGFRTWYAGDLRAGHPVIDPRRHEEFFRLNARNRVWLGPAQPALAVQLGLRRLLDAGPVAALPARSRTAQTLVRRLACRLAAGPVGAGGEQAKAEVVHHPPDGCFGPLACSLSAPA